MKFSKKISSGLVAVAVAASCGYASAATVAAGGADRISRQGAGQAAAGSMTLVDASVQLNGSYAANDEMTLTLSGQGEFGALTPATQSKVICSSAGTGTFTLAFLSRPSATTITYYVEQVGSTSSVGSLCTFSSLGLLNSTLTTAGANTGLVVSSKKAGTATPFDNDVTSAVTIASVVDQFSATVLSVFNGEIDVSTSRLAFTNGTADATSGAVVGSRDTFAFSIAAVAVDKTAASVANGSVSVSITAPSGWSFLDTNSDGIIDTSGSADAVISTSVGGASSVTLASGNALTFTVNTLAAQTITLTVGRTNATAAGTAFEAQTFSSTGISMKAGSAAALVQSATPGTWSLNGTTVQVPYLPYGTSIDQNIRINNRSTQSAGVTVQARNAAGTLCAASTLTGVTVSANQVKDISAQVKDYVNNCFSSATDAPNHRVSLSITTNLPSAQTEVYTGFTVNSTTTGPSRVTVVNSSNGK